MFSRSKETQKSIIVKWKCYFKYIHCRLKKKLNNSLELKQWFPDYILIGPRSNPFTILIFMQILQSYFTKTILISLSLLNFYYSTFIHCFKLSVHKKVVNHWDRDNITTFWNCCFPKMVLHPSLVKNSH